MTREGGRYAHERIAGRFILHALFRRGKIWYGRVRDERTGEVHVRSSRETQKRRARDAIVEWIHEIKAADEGAVSPARLEDATSEWLKMKRSFCEEVTLRPMRSILKRILGPFESLDVDQVTYAMIERRFADAEWKPSTWNQYQKILADFFDWAKKRHYTLENPAREIPTKREPPSDRRALSIDEARTLLRTAREVESPFLVPLLVFLHTGLRRKNVFGLRWRNVDFESPDFKRGALRFDQEPPTMKSKRDFAIPMHPELRRALSTLRGARVPGERELVFSFPWKHLEGPFERLEKWAGIEPRVTFHELRHTFSSWLALRVPWAVQQALLDHRPSKGPGGEASRVTWDYTHVPPSALVEGVEAIPYLLDEPEGESRRFKSPGVN